MKRKRALVLIGALSVGSILILPRFVGPKTLKEVSKVEVRLWMAEVRDPRLTTNVPEPAPKPVYVKLLRDIRQTVAMSELFNSGKPASEHKCPNTGELVFHTPQGLTVVGLLPGHSEEYYEMRSHGKLYRVSRSRLISTFQDAGIPTGEICLDGHPKPLTE